MHEPRFLKFVIKVDEEVANHMQIAEDELAECLGVFKRHYSTILRIFDYCCAVGDTWGKAAYSVDSRSYTMLLATAGITDTVKLTVEDERRIFTVCNMENHNIDDEYHPAHSQQDELNPDNCLMRFEFMEALVRLAVHRYGYKAKHLDVSECLEKLLTTLVGAEPLIEASLDANVFRADHFYNKKVEAVLKRYLAHLRTLFEDFSSTHTMERRMKHRFGLEEALKLMKSARILGHHISIRETRYAFFRSRMVVANEVLDWEKFTSLSFVEYLEFLARCADAMDIPTSEEMEAAGVSDLQHYFAGAHRRVGASKGGKTPFKIGSCSRPLEEKLDLFLRYLFVNLPSSELEKKLS